MTDYFPVSFVWSLENREGQKYMLYVPSFFIAQQELLMFSLFLSPKLRDGEIDCLYVSTMGQFWNLSLEGLGYERFLCHFERL